MDKSKPAAAGIDMAAQADGAVVSRFVSSDLVCS
jgi:hypothetical protein